MHKAYLMGAGLLFMTLACGLGSSAEPAQPGELETVVAATIQALTASAPAATPDGTSVSFQNVSFILPKGLGSGATSELVPEATEDNSDPWSIAPAHILFKISGYSAAAESLDAVVRVYPAQEYAAVNSWAQASISRLQAVLASPSAELTNETLPTVPFNGAAAQQYAAQPKILAFNGGSGVRMVSQYGQFPGPITRENSFYHFEGLTADGKYMLAILLPVGLPLKSTAEDPSADGVPFPDFNSGTPQDFAAYYQGITDLLNAAQPGSFQPALSQLDSLVQSITVSSQ